MDGVVLSVREKIGGGYPPPPIFRCLKIQPAVKTRPNLLCVCALCGCIGLQPGILPKMQPLIISELCGSMVLGKIQPGCGPVV